MGKKTHPVVIFGAGKRGMIWANFLENMNIPVFAVCDNTQTGHLKTHYLENEYPQEYLKEELIRIMMPMELDRNIEYFILLSMESHETWQCIIDQLKCLGVSCKVFIGDAYQKLPSSKCKEKIITFSDNHEDIILYHALRNVENVFYIDVGANDPWNCSVTQLFYLNKGRGINIDANYLYCELYRQTRKRDINLNVAVGDASGEVLFPLDYAGWGTLNQEYITLIENSGRIEKKEKMRVAPVKVDTLANIIKQHVPEGQEIHFCKIDTEGYEEKCLQGMDWQYNRPWIFCIESVLETENGLIRTDLIWEHILKENDYTSALMDLNNKYYVAKEHQELIKELLPRWYLLQLYDCYTPHLLETCNATPESFYFWNREIKA